MRSVARAAAAIALALLLILLLSVQETPRQCNDAFARFIMDSAVITGAQLR